MCTCTHTPVHTHIYVYVPNIHTQASASLAPFTLHVTCVHIYKIQVCIFMGKGAQKPLNCRPCSTMNQCFRGPFAENDLQSTGRYCSTPTPPAELPGGATSPGSGSCDARELRGWGCATMPVGTSPCEPLALTLLLLPLGPRDAVCIGVGRETKAC